MTSIFEGTQPPPKTRPKFQSKQGAPWKGSRYIYIYMYVYRIHILSLYMCVSVVGFCFSFNLIKFLMIQIFLWQLKRYDPHNPPIVLGTGFLWAIPFTPNLKNFKKTSLFKTSAWNIMMETIKDTISAFDSNSKGCIYIYMIYGCFQK